MKQSAVAVATFLVLAGTAKAQGEATESEGNSEEAAQGEEATPGEVVITDKARAHFRAGVNLLQDPDGARYEEAYQQFRAAYDESPSWKILGNLGLSAMKIERDGEAIDALKGYLEEGGDQIESGEREQYQRDLETLQASVVTLAIESTPPGATIKDERITARGQSIFNQYTVPDTGRLVIRVRAGNHKLSAELPGHQKATWESQLAAGGEASHTFELFKEEEVAKLSTGTAGPADGGTERPIPTSVWIGAGVTGGLAVGAVVTGSLALSANGKYNDANGTDDPEVEDKRNKVKTLNLVTDVLIGSAVAAGAVTTILYVTRPEKPKTAGLQIDPLLSPQFAGLSLSGAF